MAQAVTYHLGKLIDCYVGFLDWVAREHGSALQPSAAPRFGGEIAQYFEFEALITAVVRAYETARFPIWTAFGSETKCPRSFVETIERSNVPPPLNDCVAEALRSCMRAKQYRNCIQHHAHFGAVYQFSRIKQYNGLVWGAQTFIPDNPTAKSNDKFVYENRMDALSFGWALTSDLLRDLVDLVRGLPQR